MLVIHVQGDVNFQALTMGNWDFDQTRECSLERLSLSTKGAEEDILLCGDVSRKAWNTMWLKSEIQSALLAASRRLPVRFHSAGHRRGKGPKLWVCRRTPDWMECN